MTEEQEQLFDHESAQSIGDIDGGEAPELETCLGCETVLNLDVDDMYWSNVKQGMICAGCEQSDMETASNVWFVPAVGEKERVLVGSYRIVDHEYMEDFDRVKLTRTWHRTDGWRGYYETSLEGYVELQDLTGWTTGMPDVTTGRKHILNDWLQSVSENENESGVDFAIVTEVTSNVFSIAVGVWVKKGQEDSFKAWLADEYGVLENALR